MDQSEIDAIVVEIYEQYRIDLDPNDPLFGLMLVVVERLILDDKRRCEELSGRLGLVLDGAVDALKELTDQKKEEFSGFADSKFSRLMEKLAGQLRDAEQAHDQTRKEIRALLETPIPNGTREGQKNSARLWWALVVLGMLVVGNTIISFLVLFVG